MDESYKIKFGKQCVLQFTLHVVQFSYASHNLTRRVMSTLVWSCILGVYEQDYFPIGDNIEA